MIISIAILVVLIGVGQFLFMLKKDRTYFHSPPYEDYQKDSSVLVVYYSRTGNTEALARAIAREFRANILKLTEDKCQNQKSKNQNRLITKTRKFLSKFYCRDKR